MKKQLAAAGLAAVLLAASAVSTAALADPLIQANVLSRTDEQKDQTSTERDGQVTRSETRAGDKDLKHRQKNERQRLADRQKEQRDDTRDRHDD